MGNTEKFDNMASAYDTLERVNIANISTVAVKDVLCNKSYKTALDFGCGTGLVGINLIKDFEKIFFLDTSLNMLQVVDEKIRLLNIDSAETLYLNLEENDTFELDIKVDCIFMCQVLLHINDYMPVLKKLSKLLNSMGSLIIVDFDKNPDIVSDLVHNGFNQTELAKEIKSLGFSSVESKNFHSGKNIFMNQDATMFVLKAEL